MDSLSVKKQFGVAKDANMGKNVAQNLMNDSFKNKNFVYLH
jgi:hypothetical protein